MNDDSRAMFAEFCEGRSEAAAEIFRRYVRRLTTLARARLAPAVGRRVDPDDAVQSAFRSFFIGARSGKFSLEHSGDLWRLLATITAHKASRLTTHHRAAKRTVRRDATFEAAGLGDDSEPRLGDALVDMRIPSPDEAAVLADELAQWMKELDPTLRKTLELRLQDVATEEIAGRMKCSTRTVRRRLEQLRAILERRATNGELMPATTRERERPKDTQPQAKRDAWSRAAASSLPTIDYRELVIQLHIGSGGMGRVYRVWRRNTEETAALKVLRKALHRHPVAVRRFREEAELITALDHPGIVKLRGVGRMPGGSHFFLMDLIEGGDLSQVPTAELTEERIASWIRQTAEAVAYANGRGIVHCDLKPSNLLLDRDGRVVVADFGLAAALNADQTALGATLRFAPPELLCPELGPVSAATDVWGLGAVLAWLLYGIAPWRETSTAALIARIRSGIGPEVPFDARDQGLRLQLATVCRRCLEIAPAARYASCAEVAAQILLPRREGARRADEGQCS